ncbi:MAG TPA: peptidoglycan DD-metalloendopeptidase family protein [Alphaproteobacteria bacterium]|nr:peptidoglycan DD-metalloendopeptidase family protein [Alphaproteobacteria bacterium]
MILRRLYLCTAVLLIAASAHAATQDDLNQVENKLSAQKEQAAALEEKARQASEGIHNLRSKLVEATSALQAKEEEQSALEDKLDQLKDDIDDKTKSLDVEKHKLNILTDAMLELSRRPPQADMLQTNMTTDNIHRAIVLRAVLPQVRQQTDTVAHDLIALSDLQVQMAEQKHLVIAAQDNLQGQQRDLDQLIATRQGSLQQTEEQKQSVSRQLVSLTNEAKDLRQLLEKVSPQRAPRPGHAPALKTVLRAPVAGSLLRGFGGKDSYGVSSQGLTYVALPGSPIVAPQAGKVVFAGPFRGYGQILILQHDDGYHSFLAGFGRIDAEMGQEVSAGEPLGVLPLKKEGRPELYFEWRRNNEPVDPTDGIALSKSR